MITGAWIIAGLFLNYNYQGNNIDQLTSPLDPSKIETLQEILDDNFTIFSLPNFYDELASRANNVTQTQSGWPANQTSFGTMYAYLKGRNTTQATEAELGLIVKVPTNNKKEVNEMLSLMYYAKMLAKCGKDGFADVLPYVNKLHSKMLQINIHESQISRSKAPFGQMYNFWNIMGFQATAKHYAGRRLGLIQSGILYLWNEWKNRVDSWNDTVNAAKVVSNSVKPVSILDNAVVVFYVDFTLKAVCVFIFFCEFSTKVYTTAFYKALLLIFKKVYHQSSGRLVLVLGHLIRH